MSLPVFEVYLPSSLQDAVTFLSENVRDTKVIAGGTDLVPSLKQKLFEPQYLLDIKPIQELHGIHETPDGGVRIGALTTITEMVENPLLQHHFSVLQQAAATVAGPSLRNVGTLGGNICLDTRCYWYNQSYFWRQSCGFCIKKDGSLCHVAPGSKTCWAVYSGDTAAALLTLDARLKLISARGERLVTLPDFFVNDGLVRNRMEPDEILSEVHIPAKVRDYQGAYEKYRIRGSVDYPLAGVAIAMKGDNGSEEDLRVALTAVNPLPLLLKDPVSLLRDREELQKLAQRTAKPLKTSASTMEYRRHIIGIMLKRALEKLN
ncbi:FAD binding domain-containing protein [bacterium]|nr:FAD binding domain-containing protein [bacterium]MCI0606697.1 FAD binding domain-containing protein [bacterium]